mmetsp:Transcript_5002/g.12192  ORF Transcript_5002/g.12192 Transcript_5002/m.12192 type:complete len:259 (+) Transcript_5002:497-1273(+)
MSTAMSPRKAPESPESPGLLSVCPIPGAPRAIQHWPCLPQWFSKRLPPSVKLLTTSDSCLVTSSPSLTRPLAASPQASGSSFSFDVDLLRLEVAEVGVPLQAWPKEPDSFAASPARCIPASGEPGGLGTPSQVGRTKRQRPRAASSVYSAPKTASLSSALWRFSSSIVLAMASCSLAFSSLRASLSKTTESRASSSKAFLEAKRSPIPRMTDKSCFCNAFSKLSRLTYSIDSGRRTVGGDSAVAAGEQAPGRGAMAAS